MRKNIFITAAVAVFLLNISLAQAQTATPEVSPTPTPAVTGSLEKLKEQQVQISDKEKEIKELEKKISTLKSQRDSVAADAQIIASQLQKLSDQLKKSQLELQQTTLGIQVTLTQKKTTETSIEELEQQITDSKEKLRQLLAVLYEREQASWVTIFFDTWSLSDVLQERSAYKELQDRAIVLVKELHTKNDDLHQKAQALEDQHQQLSSLESALAEQQTAIADQKNEQQKFLQAKKEQQIAYEGKISEVEAAKEEIKKQVFTLKNAGVEVSLNNAFDMARFAGKLTGVRPALLLAVLKVESNLGGNVGSGHYPDDMHPASRDAFVRITKELGIDPKTTPVSRRPRSGNGWGGAMGPAQIMPATWEGIAPRLATMLHKSVPDPFNLTDAFAATAIFLADRGAANPALEYEAVNKYIAGPYWQYHTWYGDRVLAVAKEYAAQGL